jgi:hypothetical protein
VEIDGMKKDSSIIGVHKKPFEFWGVQKALSVIQISVSSIAPAQTGLRG